MVAPVTHWTYESIMKMACALYLLNMWFCTLILQSLFATLSPRIEAPRPACIDICIISPAIQSVSALLNEMLS